MYVHVYANRAVHQLIPGCQSLSQLACYQSAVESFNNDFHLVEVGSAVNLSFSIKERTNRKILESNKDTPTKRSSQGTPWQLTISRDWLQKEDTTVRHCILPC